MLYDLGFICLYVVICVVYLVFLYRLFVVSSQGLPCGKFIWTESKVQRKERAQPSMNNHCGIALLKENLSEQKSQIMIYMPHSYVASKENITYITWQFYTPSNKNISNICKTVGFSHSYACCFGAAKVTFSLEGVFDFFFWNSSMPPSTCLWKWLRGELLEPCRSPAEASCDVTVVSWCGGFGCVTYPKRSSANRFYEGKPCMFVCWGYVPGIFLETCLDLVEFFWGVITWQ